MKFLSKANKTNDGLMNYLGQIAFEKD